MTDELFPEFEAKIKLSKPELASLNPCVRLYGFAEDRSKKCGECVHLYGIQKSRVYWKCKLRKLTFGPGSDHRVRWPACAKFQSERTRSGS